MAQDRYQEDLQAGYEALIDRFVIWAEAREDTRAAAVIGSRARVDHPADAWSDLDMILVTDEPDRYIHEAAWLAEIGDVIVTFAQRTSGEGWERRVLFDGWLDVDFVAEPPDRVRAARDGAVDDSADAWNFLGRGHRVIVDKMGAEEALARATRGMARPPAAAPSPAEFMSVVDDFWYHAVWTAKRIRRGELFWAKRGCDEKLKALLLRALNWHAQAMHGADHDTWFRGRFLEEWAERRAVSELRDAYAHYDRDDVARALPATMRLFRRVCSETCAAWGLAEPRELAETVTTWVEGLLLEAGEPPSV